MENVESFNLPQKKCSVLKYSQSLEHGEDPIEIFPAFAAKYLSCLLHVLPFL